jgi:capsid protein
MTDNIYTNAYTLPVNFDGAESNYKIGLRGLFNDEGDSIAVKELRFLQSRSANLCRNNGYAKTALKNWTTKAGYIKTVWKDKNGKTHKVMQGYWDEFAANPCIDGFGDLRVAQSVSNSSLFLTGNSYIRKLIVREGNTSTVPLKLQLIPSILHDVGVNNLVIPDKGREVTRYGITFKDSIPIKYHFRKSILERGSMDYTLDLVSVPSEEIIHSFIREEPGQWIGIPMLASVILSLYALEDLMSATVNKQKAAQSIAVIVESLGTTLTKLPVGGVGTVKETDGTDKIAFKNSTDESQVLYPSKGESVKMFQGTDIGPNFGVLVEKELRKVASVTDSLYHELTGDTVGLNYSSLIGLAIQSRNRLEYLHNFLPIPLR